ncbi:MAG: M48 family metallopeptidase [Clostridia bacterium]|nr:M48 family metallopeptidase [Clostridia bacterium]
MKKPKADSTYVQVNGISVEIVRKNVKNCNLSVKPPDGQVRLSAPFSVPQAQLIAFVSAKTDWIRSKQDRMRATFVREERQYVSGETIMVFGEPCTLVTGQPGEGKSKQIEKIGHSVFLPLSGQEDRSTREKRIREWYRGLLKEKIRELLPFWEEKTGLHADAWQIKNMKTRWGTCNTRTKKIWLNLRLAQKPPECLSYVILHELAHTKVPNHGPQFCEILDRYMPAWKAIRQRMDAEPVE